MTATYMTVDTLVTVVNPSAELATELKAAGYGEKLAGFVFEPARDVAAYREAIKVEAHRLHAAHPELACYADERDIAILIEQDRITRSARKLWLAKFGAGPLTVIGTGARPGEWITATTILEEE